MKKTKENVYVVIDTPKKAKKVKEVLDMFGEKIERYTNETLSDYNKPCTTAGDGVPALFYSNRSVFIGEHVHSIKDRERVSIKELRNILAVENLKEGDVVVVDNNHGKWIVKLTGNDIERFEHSASYDLDMKLLNDKESIHCSNKIYGGSFIRYATEEEKALLEDKPKLEVGKWYKHDNGEFPNWIVFYDEKSTYGFATSGTWFETNGYDYEDMLEYMTEQDLEEATKEEVEQALIKEAKKRGYADGVKVHSFVHNRILQINNSEKEIEFLTNYNKLHYGSDGSSCVVVFENGKWAAIIKPSFVESSDKIKVAGENIGKRVRVIDGGSGATGCNGQTGIIVEKPKECLNGSLKPVIYIKLDNGHTWGLAMDHKIEYLTESSPLTVSLEIKDIATLQVIQKTLKELEEKLTKLI